MLIPPAFRAMDAVGINVEVKFLKPELLFAREEDEPAMTLAAFLEHVHIETTGNCDVVLSRRVRRKDRFKEDRLAPGTPAMIQILKCNRVARLHTLSSKPRMGHQIAER